MADLQVLIHRLKLTQTMRKSQTAGLNFRSPLYSCVYIEQQDLFYAVTLCIYVDSVDVGLS